MKQKDVERAYVLEGIRTLKDPHKILLWGIIKEHNEIKKLIAWYNRVADFMLSSRRLSDYLVEIEFLGYISRREKAWGKEKG